MTHRRLAIGLTVALVAATALLDLASNVTVLWQTTWLFWVVSATFFLLRFRYIKQGEPNLVTALEGSALLIVFTSIFGIATYLIPEHRSSMWDTELVAMDAIFGLNSGQLIEATRQFPNVDFALSKIYHVLYLHLALIVVYAAGVRRDNGRAFRFLGEMFVAAWFGLILFAILPAYNAIDFFSLPDTHRTLGIVSDLRAIRDGTFAVLDFKKAKGLVQFPSFHMAVQIVLFADIVRNEKRWVAAIFAVWTVLMTWATVVIGAHYVVDLVGGMIIAGIGIAVGTWIARRGESSEPE